MTYTTFMGIDLSKETFVVAVQPEVAPTVSFPNTPSGVPDLSAAHRRPVVPDLCGAGSDGGYEADLLVALVQQGGAVHRADPRAASFFLRSLGTRAKTDSLDAQGLARYGAERHAELPRSHLPDATQEQLSALLSRRADLLAMRTAEGNRQQHPRYRTLAASVEVVLRVLQEQITGIEAQVAELIRTSPVLRAKATGMTQLTGIGQQTAQTLLAFLPELGTLPRHTAASLAGCAPHPRDSGTLRGYRRTVGGRAVVKRALFMAAMAARTHHPELRQFSDRLRHNGKPPMVALTAIMRKLIIILNAKLRDAAAAATWYDVSVISSRLYCGGRLNLLIFPSPETI